MFCAWCRSRLDYVHGHAACLNGTCPMFGLNQAECCDGETAATCPAPTATVARRTDGWSAGDAPDAMNHSAKS